MGTQYQQDRQDPKQGPEDQLAFPQVGDGLRLGFGQLERCVDDVRLGGSGGNGGKWTGHRITVQWGRAAIGCLGSMADL